MNLVVTVNAKKYMFKIFLMVKKILTRISHIYPNK